MASLSTYNELRAAVASYLGRDDLDEQIPTFIRMAEKRIDRDLRLRCMERRATAQVQAGAKGTSLPCRHVDGDWDVETPPRAWGRLSLDVNLGWGYVMKFSFDSYRRNPKEARPVTSGGGIGRAGGLLRRY